MLSFKLYSFVSILLFGGAIINSYTINEQFYPTIIYLAQQKVNRVITLNFFFMIYLGINLLTIDFIFGEIREVERMNVLEKVKRKILDLALILIFFKEESLDMFFIVMLIGLVGICIIHWMTIKRSEFLIAESQSSLRPHLKISFFFVFLILMDVLIMKYQYAYQAKFSEKKVLISLFGLEILLMSIKLVLPFIKYLISIFEFFTYSHFENKNTIFSFLEFIFTTAKLIVRLITMVYVQQNFGLPLHLISDAIEDIIRLYSTFKNFFFSIKISYQLNQLEDITDQDLKEIDTTCLICLHEMQSGKKINCGHIFHYSCLKTWVQGAVNQFCPKCKAPLNIEEAVNKYQGHKQLNVMSEQHKNLKTKKNNLENQIDSLKINSLLLEIQLIEQFATIKSKMTSDNVQPNQNIWNEQANQQILQEQLVDLQKYTDVHNIGSVSFGLPKEVNYCKTVNDKVMMQKIELMNKLLISFQKNPNLFRQIFNSQQINQILNINIQEFANENEEDSKSVDQQIPEGQIKKSQSVQDSNLDINNKQEKDPTLKKEMSEQELRRNIWINKYEQNDQIPHQNVFNQQNIIAQPDIKEEGEKKTN